MSPVQQAPLSTPSLPSPSSQPTVSSGDFTSVGFDNSSSPMATYGSSGATATPTRVFIQDNQSTVQIDVANLTTPNGFPANFQIWYSGGSPLNLDLTSSSGGAGSFNGMIYAPFAQVNITGNGSFTGAMVANSINVTSKGSINIANNLSTSSGVSASAPNSGLSYSSSGGSGVDQVAYWTPVSWQEVPP